MSSEREQNRDKKRFVDRLIILITVTASLATIVYYATSPTFRGDVLESASNCKTFFFNSFHQVIVHSDADREQNSMEEIARSNLTTSGANLGQSTSDANLPTAISSNLNNLSTKDASTDYLFNVQNDTESDWIGYSIYQSGKLGPRHVLPPQDVEHNVLRTPNIQIFYNASAWNEEDRYCPVSPLAVSGRPILEDDWENAPVYSFELNDDRRIELTNYDNN